MRFAIACLLLVLTGLSPPGPAGAAEVDLELVLAADGSGSIDADEFRTQRQGYADALTHPRVLQAIAGGYHGAIAVAYTEWGGADSQHTIVDWQVIRDAASARAFADKLLAAPRRAQGYNSISGAIAHGQALIEGNDFAAARRVIDVSGDGPQIGGPPLAPIRNGAVLAGITINALVVKRPGGGYPGPGGMPLDRHYERDVIGGRGSFVMVADETIGFTDALLNKLVMEIAGGRAPARYAERRR